VVAEAHGRGYRLRVLSLDPTSASSWRDAALLLIAHGSSVNEDSARAAREHAERIRSRGWFREVAVAFWKQEPFVVGALERPAAARVFVAPLFISEGYFTEQAIPEALGLKDPAADDFARCQRRDGKAVWYCRPVGTHEAMTSVLLDRAAEVVTRHPFPRVPPERETALVLAGHGTDRNANSRRAIEWHAERIRRLERFAEVHSVFIEEPPRIADARAITRAPNLVVVPFFISDGLHTAEDIPVLLGATEETVRERRAAGLSPWRNPTSRDGRRIWYAATAGTDPLVAEVVLARVREAERGAPAGPAGLLPR
jgi:sirohydrochlorin cobaltochelatase